MRLQLDGGPDVGYVGPAGPRVEQRLRQLGGSTTGVRLDPQGLPIGPCAERRGHQGVPRTRASSSCDNASVGGSIRTIMHFVRSPLFVALWPSPARRDRAITHGARLRPRTGPCISLSPQSSQWAFCIHDRDEAFTPNAHNNGARRGSCSGVPNPAASTGRRHPPSTGFPNEVRRESWKCAYSR